MRRIAANPCAAAAAVCCSVFLPANAQDILWQRGGLTFSPQVIQFTADGSRLLTAGDQGVKTWDPATGEFLGTQSEPGFGRFGSMVSAVSEGRTHLLWGGRDLPGLNQTRLQDGVLERRYLLHLTNAYRSTWSRSGRWVATSGLSGPPQLWDLDTGAALQSPAGSLGAAEGRVAYFIHSVGNGDLVVTFDQHTERWAVREGIVRWTSDHWVVATDLAGQRGLAIPATLGSRPPALLRMEDGTVESEWSSAPEEYQPWPEFSPDGQQVALGLRGALEVRDSRTGVLLDRVADPGGDSILTIAWSPAPPRRIAYGSSRALRVWTPNTPEAPRMLAGIPNAIRAMARSPDDRRILAADQSSTLLLLEASSGAEIRRVPLPSCRSVAWPGTGWAAVARGDDLVWLDPETLEARRTNASLGFVGPLAAARSAPRVIAIASGNQAAVFDASSGNPLAQWSLGGDSGVSIAADLSPDGRHAAIRLRDGAVQVWSVEGPSVTSLGTWADASAVAFAFSADGHQLIGVRRSSNGIPPHGLWTWTPGMPPVSVELDAQVGDPRDAAYSPDQRLVLIEDGAAGIAVCDAGSGRLLERVTTETVGQLLGQIVSSDGRWFVSRLDGVMVALSGPLWITDLRRSGAGRFEVQALGRPGPFQVEQRPLGAGIWNSVGGVQAGPSLELQEPSSDTLWRVKTAAPEQAQDF